MTSRDVLDVSVNIETNHQRNTVSYQPSEAEQVPERQAAKNAQAAKTRESVLRRSSIKAPPRKDGRPSVQSAAALGNTSNTRQEARR
jgi:hypothetical protein